MRTIAAVLGLLGLIGGAAGAQLATPEPGRFVAFFDWGEAAPTRDGTDVLNQVAAEYAKTPGAHLSIAGYSDRSGSEAANLASSRKRAETVRAYLAAHGVPAAAMTVTAYGETRPLVPTADGVREVQNRRVEVVFGRDWI